MGNKKLHYSLGILRLIMGFVFFWAFIDKLFGLGFATAPERSWLAGGSPTSGFLLNATKGPLESFFKGMTGNAVVDWLFMLGLFAVGITLLLGIKVRFGSYIGILMMALMYLAMMLPANNPVVDEHIVYIMVLLILAFTGSGRWLGFGNWWRNTQLVKKYPILE